MSNDVKLILVKWIETLHSLTNLDITRCVPMFLNIFLNLLNNKEIKHSVTEAVSLQLKQFKNDYSTSSSRSVELDLEIIKQINKFLIENKEA